MNKHHRRFKHKIGDTVRLRDGRFLGPVREGIIIARFYQNGEKYVVEIPTTTTEIVSLAEIG